MGLDELFRGSVEHEHTNGVFQIHFSYDSIRMETISTRVCDCTVGEFVSELRRLLTASSLVRFAITSNGVHDSN